LRRLSTFAALVLVGWLLPVGTISAQDSQGGEEPLEIGLTERTGTSVLFLDVEALDKQGRPMPGLVKDDFKIRVNYIPRNIYSVDNLCPCLVDPDPSKPGACIDPQSSPQQRRQNRPLYVLYFDTSQLQLDGRAIALDQARRWIRDVKQPQDQAIVVAFARETGVRRVTPMTADGETLMQGIQRVDDDPDMRDEFPSKLASRMKMCIEGTVSCYYASRKDYFQSRASFRSLLNFVTELDEMPERKVLLFFHQNNSIFPGRLYAAPGSAGAQLDFAPDDPTGMGRQIDRAVFGAGDSLGGVMFDGSDSGVTPDLVSLVDAIGGTATASRTTIFPIVAGTDQTWAVNFGANVADYTGGKYNRDAAEMTALIDTAGQGCGCFYRIGLRIDERAKSKVFRTKVKIKGKELHSQYRVQYVTAADRWMRKAQSILENPAEFTDVELQAAIVPFRGGGNTWDLRVQVAVDLETLQLARENVENLGEWEIGALLADSRGKQDWEMLAVSRLREKPPERQERPDLDREQETAVVHERTFRGLKAGTYQLRAFIKDRTAKLYGGVETEIHLPVVEERSLVGPIARRAGVPHFSSSLPLRDQKKASQQSRSASLKDSVPRTDARFEHGVPIEFTTWACPAYANEVRGQVARSVLAGESSVLEPGKPKTNRAGECVAISDTIDTAGLAPGHYTYRAAWNGAQDVSPLQAEATFEIVGSEDP
jgi:VWFA-related protein